MKSMATPQQPELARNRRSAVSPGAAKGHLDGPVVGGVAVGPMPSTGPIPEDNLPGHHPEHEQDKPQGPPRRRPPEPPSPPRPHRLRFSMAFSWPESLASLAVGVTPFNSGLDIDEGRLVVRYGPWSLRTSVDNVVGAEVGGPWPWYRTLGPPHLSLVDRGVTFATTSRRGVCLRLAEPVAALLPWGILRHPNVTVTVADPEGLVKAVVGD